jgi:periplasmic protein TonB
MDLKKTEIASIEKRSSVFFIIGLIIAIGCVFTALELTSKPRIETPVSSADYKTKDTEYPVEQKISPIPHLPVEQVTKVTPLQADVLKIVRTQEKIITNNDNNNPPKVIIEEELKIQPIPMQNIKNYKVQSEMGALKEPIYMRVEEMPQFQGEDANTFREWIKMHTRYPQIAIENGISGSVKVQFSVNQTGQVVDVVVVRPVDPALDKEAIRVISSSPRWTPGRQRGRPVKVQFNFSVYFEIQQSD